ncbi:MAG: RNA polymerase factor sigma-32 [Desulfobacterales bacterium]|jgi:RNA polymerase sigma-32 factor
MLTEVQVDDSSRTTAHTDEAVNIHGNSESSETNHSFKTLSKKSRDLAGNTDAFQRYLVGISKYNLLTRSEEKDLFKRVKMADDKQAAQKLVTSNLRLVVKIAMDYSNIWMQNLLDLIQEGNLGLIKAVEKFNPERNVKFSYYASFWIKAYIIKHLMDNWRLVKIGTTQAQRKLFFKLKSEKQKLKDDGFEPSAELLAERLGVPQKDVVEMDQRINNWDVSLDAPLTDGSDTARIDLLRMPADTLDERVSQKELMSILRHHIEKVCKTLDPREQHIFNQRIIAEDPKTLSEIGKSYGISRERVRQIQKGIVSKLRDSLKQYMPDYAAYSERGRVDYDVSH